VVSLIRNQVVTLVRNALVTLNRNQVVNLSGISNMLAYMKWLVKNVKKGEKPFGTGTEKLVFMDHPADAEKGQAAFVANNQPGRFC